MVKALLASVVVLVACQGKSAPSKPPPDARAKPAKPPRPRCEPAYARHLCAGGDENACGWVAGLDQLDYTDDELRALIPALADKTIDPGAPPVPPAPTYVFESSPPYTVPWPVDWAADPGHGRSWRANFQSLNWLYSYYAKSETELDLAGYVIFDWARQALAPDATLEFTWNDAGLAKRLERVSGFLTRYLADRQTVNRSVVAAAVRVIDTHIHAMSADVCYSEHSNHGMMQDLALVKYARVLPGLADTAPLHASAVKRLVAHVAASVTDEGIHVENSPEYHVMYLRLIVDAIDVFAEVGEPAPRELVAARDGLQAALIHMLQPNLTLPQFGDSTNNGPQRVIETLDAARRQGAGDSAVLDALSWVVTRGVSGTRPAVLDRVFAASGYAAFRERWDGGADAITAHFKSGRLSSTHDHDDDTTFELYGHGTELVVDTGKYSYEYANPLVVHQYDIRAHNVLVVDDAPIDKDPKSRIVAHGDGWVRGEHHGYASRAVAIARTFAYARPDTFVVVDRVTAAADHDYAQHFHLHPSITDVQVIDDRTVVARVPGGASLTLTAGELPVGIDVLRGQNDESGVQGWYFCCYQSAEPTADVVLRYGTRAAPTLPVVLTITAPKRKPVPASAVSMDGEAVRWNRGTKLRAVVAP